MACKHIEWLLQKTWQPLNYIKMGFDIVKVYTSIFLTLSCFCGPQSIQRRLEEIEVTFKELEEKGVVLERTLREEAGKHIHGFYTCYTKV